MKLNLAILRLLFATLCFAFAWSIPAHAELVLGKQYTLVSPAQPTETGKNIEVLEFFSYACPHCNDLEPTLQSLGQETAQGRDFPPPACGFQRHLHDSTPGYFIPLKPWVMLDKLHPAIFNAVHVAAY